jgi:hypothetical protein
MLKMYFFRAGSVSDFVQNDFGDLDLCTGDPWDAAVINLNLRGDPDCHWLQYTPTCLGVVAGAAPAEADQALLDAMGMIEAQQVDGGSGGGRKADEVSAFRHEVFMPVVAWRLRKCGPPGDHQQLERRLHKRD